MNYSRNPKVKNRAVPTKVRRRQSDAKWRASVQSCYESLKFIIPESRRLNRRKLSKAFILQETENHICFLEDVLGTLLEEKEKFIAFGLNVTSKNSPRNLLDVQEEFALKIQPPLTHLPKPRRCPEESPCIPHRVLTKAPPVIENKPKKLICTLFQGEHYYYLKGKTLCLRQATPTKCDRNLTKPALNPASSISELRPSNNIDDFIEIKENLPPTILPLRLNSTVAPNSEEANPELSYLLTHTEIHSPSNQNAGMPHVTPKKKMDEEGVGPRSPWLSSAMSSIQHHPAFLTPSKITKKLPFDISTPSPVKASFPRSPEFGLATSSCKESPGHSGMDSLFQTGSFMEVPTTPVLRTDEDTSGLLCTESIDSMELGDDLYWHKDIHSLEDKATRSGDKVQQTPLHDTTSCCPSEKELQNRPRKVLKRGVTSLDTDSDITPAKVFQSETRPKCCKQLESLYDDACVPDKSILSNDLLSLTFDSSSPSLSSQPDFSNELPEACLSTLCDIAGFGDDSQMNSDNQNCQQVPVNVISIPDVKTEGNDFDGYYYFYRQMSGELRKHLNDDEMNSSSFSEAISQMWKDMNEDQKTTLVTIAALENSDSSSSTATELSQDLSEIAVVPIANSTPVSDCTRKLHL